MEIKDSIRFSEALAFASIKHKKQQRKDGNPYILHTIKVAMYLAEEGFDYRYQIVGLFHDLLEDTDTTEFELKAYCDEEMIEAIKLVTKREGQTETEYINNILKHPMAKAVKNADRIDNLTDLKNSDNKAFRNKYIAETNDYFLGSFSKELDSLYEELMQEI